MAVSVRMDPLLESELERAAQRRGITKSQFIIAAVERALGRRNPYELMQELKAEEPQLSYAVADTAVYETARSKAAMIRKLGAKHGVGRAR